MGHHVITSDFRDWNMSLESHLLISDLFLSPDYCFRPGRKKVQSYTAAKGQWLSAFGPKGKEGRRDMQSHMGPAVGLCLAWRQQQLILGCCCHCPALSRPQHIDIHVNMSVMFELEEILKASATASSFNRWGSSGPETLWFFPLSSHYKFLAKSRPEGNSLGSRPVLFTLHQHFANFHRHVTHPRNCD